jgi:ACS family sodium-dependent inorganic phosphate cotransporter-like MFS transporter 5
MTSKACIVLFIAHFTSSWGVVLFLTNAPIYMKEVLKFDIKSNGLLSSIPYMTVLIVIILSGFISDKLIKSGKMSRCNVRRLFNTLGILMPSFAMAGLGFVECDKPYFGVALLTIGLGFT